MLTVLTHFQITFKNGNKMHFSGIRKQMGWSIINNNKPKNSKKKLCKIPYASTFQSIKGLCETFVEHCCPKKCFLRSRKKTCVAVKPI